MERSAQQTTSSHRSRVGGSVFVGAADGWAVRKKAEKSASGQLRPSPGAAAAAPRRSTVAAVLHAPASDDAYQQSKDTVMGSSTS